MTISKWHVRSFGAFVALLIELTAIANAERASPSHIQAKAIIVDISARGAKATAAALYQDKDRWDEVIASIGHGRPEWLQVAVELHPETDAGASAMLDEAMFLALKPAPIAVLRLMKNQQFSVMFVCSSNIGIDYDSDKSRGIIRDRIKRLRSIDDRETDSIRLECLSGLKKALKDFD